MLGGTDLKFQVRSCDDLSCAGESFVGPDSTSNTYFADAGFSNISFLLDNQYFQYKAFFETNNADFTPKLFNVSVYGETVVEAEEINVSSVWIDFDGPRQAQSYFLTVGITKKLINLTFLITIMEITDLNAWWKTGKINEDYEKLKRRPLFKEILNYITDRQIIVITGLRRTGKTVLMHHLISHLIQNKTRPENIIYFNFDLSAGEIEKILEDHKEITNVDYKKEKIFFFLDEVQKIKDWQNKVKLLYDNYRNIKFFVSGSNSLFIEKRTKESLAGRSFSFQLLPLEFTEYLLLKNKDKLIKNPVLFKDEIKGELKAYANTGGFPELLNEKADYKIKRYVKELVIDKIVYIDIPKAFEIEEPELLQTLISIISSSPGIMIDYDSLANDLKRNRKTISNYLFYLEKSFLIKKLYNFSSNLLTNEKKKKKFYPSTTALAFLHNADYGKMVETLVLQNSSNFKFFYRKNGKEVDFISIEGKTKILPIEVKTGKKIDKGTKISIIDFMKKFKAKRSIVITTDYEAEEDFEWFGAKRKITFRPLWKWLL